MLNNITIMGRLTKDPELKTTSNDVNFCPFCVAVDREYGDKKTDFINCIAWRGTAEFINKYFANGTSMLLPFTSAAANQNPENRNR